MKVFVQVYLQEVYQLFVQEEISLKILTGMCSGISSGIHPEEIKFIQRYIRDSTQISLHVFP